MRYNFLRCIAYALETCVFFFVQQMPNENFSIGGVRPVLLISIAVTIAVFEKETIAIGFGILCGLFLDFGFSGKFGLNSFLLPIMCCFLSYLCINVVRVNLLSTILLSFACVFFVLGLHFVFYYAFRGYGCVGYMFVKKYLPRMLYTWLTVPFFYLFNKSFSAHFKEEE